VGVNEAQAMPLLHILHKHVFDEGCFASACLADEVAMAVAEMCGEDEVAAILGVFAEEDAGGLGW